MAHVQIAPTDDGAYRLLVDGVDISKAVLADSVRIGFETGTIGGRRIPTVQIELAVDRIGLDLPDAVLEALHAGDDSDGRDRVVCDDGDGA